jgi:3-oxoacyl-[acyl-carrier-protein] synthase III
MGIILRGPGIFVPNQVLTNKNLVELVDEQGVRVLETNDEKMVELSGIRERRISLDLSVQEMGILAVKDLEKRLGEKLNPDEIRLATNRHREGEYPCFAAAIGNAIGSEEVIIHDELAGCTGLVYAIRDAYNAILAGEIESALIGGVERLTDFSNYEDRTTCFLFGDGAGFYKLEQKEKAEGIIANALGGKPDMGDSEWPRGFLASKEMTGKKLKMTPKGLVAYDAVDQYLIMNGNEVFRFAPRAMRGAIHKVIHKSPYELSDVDVIIPHGANIRIIEAANKKLREKGFKGEVYTNLEKFGNTSTASIPIATEEAIKNGIIKEGSLVINVAFGAGLTYGANLYRSTLK